MLAKICRANVKYELISQICELYHVEDYGSKINYSLAVKKYQPEKKAAIVSDIFSTVLYIIGEDGIDAEKIEEIRQSVNAKSYIDDETWDMAEKAFRGVVVGVNAAVAADYYGNVGKVESGSKGNLNSYADFNKVVSDIGKRTDLTDWQKVKELQNLFENSNYKMDINVPSDIQYVKGFDAKGNIIYDWPSKLGFDENTIKPITRSDGLPDTWDRYGYMGGSNFADVPSTGKYSYSARAIPYVENEAAYHTGTFNNASYFDKIDEIKNGDIDTFNKLLRNEGISKWDLDDFEELCDSYNSFISQVNKELGDGIDATYGIKGLAAEWGDMSGGAGQIVTPFGGEILKKIGILYEEN